MSSKNENKFYITTAIPYVNARPHIGHALEFVQADVLRRYHDKTGEETLFLSGSDDNALKNVQAAEKVGLEIQKFVDQNAEIFRELLGKLNVKVDIFERGSDKNRHYPSSQKLWGLCDKAGDIYKKSYEGLYCVGCEAFCEKEELNENGECLEHLGRKPDRVSEENYFFRLSKYQDKLIQLIESNTFKIIPETRKREVLSFLSRPLLDISISRSNERAKNWGVTVPGDDSQRIYVWFDALNIYQSGVGFGWDEELYKKWWPADIHVIGKGILRFHAIYWPAFLLSAGLPLPKSLFIHGYVTVNGQKISKTVGNVIDPFEIIEKYGADPLRYYLLREIPAWEDGDFSHKKFEERYNGDLANGLGNLISRVATIGEKLGVIRLSPDRGPEAKIRDKVDETIVLYERALKGFRLNEALAATWGLISLADKYINETAPWKIQENDKLTAVVITVSYIVNTISDLLDSFIPQTAEKIKEQIHIEDSTLKIKRKESLFPRLTPH